VIRVLLVDDSSSVRAVLRRFFRKTRDIEVVGEAADGAEAVQAVIDLQPHVVVMDLQMPVLDGYEATERIMAVRPTPIVVLSSRANRNQMQIAFEAMRRGALEVLPKPEDTPSWQLLAESLPEMVRTVAQARAVPRPLRLRTTGSRPAKTAPNIVPNIVPVIAPSRPAAATPGPGELRWVAIGASTGGPAAIRELLDEVPADAPVGFLIVQHIASGFELGFADWLNKELPFDVRLAQDGEILRRGSVRLAPGGCHLRLESAGVLRLDSGTPARRGHRPSVDEMFLSAAEHCPREVAGVLMTGMGSDGVEGLLALRQAGGTTLAQDEASSVVFGMPRVAVERGATDVALPPRELARALGRLWAAKGER
jgi:two-component system, chemotaxis family, protein-glutamate methylesterase/glutaminase